MDQKLRPFERLRRSYQFRCVFKYGRCYRTTFLRIHSRRSDGDYSRVGLVVRRKLGNAGARSRIKRCLREVFRIHKYLLKQPHDVVLVAQAEEQGYHTYREAFQGFVDECNRPRRASTAGAVKRGSSSRRAVRSKPARSKPARRQEANSKR